MLRTKELEEEHVRSLRHPRGERLHLAIAWRLKWTANPSAVKISVPRMLASCRSGRPALTSKGLAGSSTAFESRFNTPASHAFAKRARNVSTIRAADGLWILAPSGETAVPIPDRDMCRRRAAERDPAWSPGVRVNRYIQYFDRSLHCASDANPVAYEMALRERV